MEHPAKMSTPFKGSVGSNPTLSANRKKTMTKPNVSVVLTSYNKPKYLQKAINSVLNQTYENITLIVADDNSPNKEVWDVITSFKDHRLVAFNSYISDEDRFKTARYATQINTAVKNYSSSKYLCYLADDDFYYPEMIDRMVIYAESSGHEVVFCAQHVLDVDGNVDGGGIDGKGVRWFSEPLVRGADKLDHNQVMTSRRVFDLVGGWEDHPSVWGGADAAFFDRIEKNNIMFYPIDYNVPLQGKVYRTNSVQWNMANGLSPVFEEK